MTGHALARESFGPGTGQTVRGGLALRLVTVEYTATPAIDAGAGNVFEITPTDNVAFVIQNPTNPSPGQRISIFIINTTGGAIGALTFGTLYRISAAAITQPATAFNRLWEFTFEGTVWRESGARTIDVAN